MKANTLAILDRLAHDLQATRQAVAAIRPGNHDSIETAQRALALLMVRLDRASEDFYAAMDKLDEQAAGHGALPLVRRQ